MGAAAPIGAGAVIAGTGLNAYGQYQGLKAQQNAIDSQMAAQRGFDDQLRRRTEELIKEVYPDAIDGQPVARELQGRLDTSAGNLVRAVQAAGSRRTGGARNGPETRALVTQASPTLLAQALQANRVAAARQALVGAGQNLDILGRQYGSDTGRIRGDAQRWSQILPLQQAAAGYKGQWARQIGNLFNMGGQMGIMAGLAQPGAGAAALSDNGNGLGVAGPSGGTEGMLFQSQGYSPSIYDFRG